MAGPTSLWLSTDQCLCSGLSGIRNFNSKPYTHTHTEKEAVPIIAHAYRINLGEPSKLMSKRETQMEMEVEM